MAEIQMGGPYVAFNITNNTKLHPAGYAAGFADSEIYLFIITGATTTTPAVAWGIDPGTGRAHQLLPGKLPPILTLDKLRGNPIKVDSSLSVSSVRIYFSTSPNAITLSGKILQFPAPGQVDFYYDFVEFALEGGKRQVNIDLTQVDQVGFPISLQANPADPNYPDGAGFHPSLTRRKIFADFKDMAKDALAPFADCIIHNTSTQDAPPYCLLSPQHVCGNALKAEVLTGTISDVGGSNGNWTALFTIAGGATNGGLLKPNMPVSGAYLPGGTIVAGLPGHPSGNTVQLSSTVGPFSPKNEITLDFVVLPSSKLATWFDQAIDDFFKYCISWPGMLKIEENNGQDVVYSASVTQVSVKSISDSISNYTVLQFTPASGSTDRQAFNIFYPFFTTNSPAGKLDPLGHQVPPPPAWWNLGMNTYEPPSQMVFGGDGVFADNTQQHSQPIAQKVLGALENAVVTGLARGSITRWLYRTGSIQPDAPNSRTGIVTITSGGSTEGLAGNYVYSFRIASVPMMINPSDIGTETFHVHSPVPLNSSGAGIPGDLLMFSTFYPATGTWSAYANFLHNGFMQAGAPVKVTIGGRAYALPFDDQGGFSTDLTSTWPAGGKASEISITLNPW